MNIVVPIIDKYKDKYNDLLSKLIESENINVYVGVEEKNSHLMNGFEECKNIFVAKFENGSNIESMINSLQRYVGVGSIIVLRKPITMEELLRFINCKHDVATCKVERSKFKNIFFSLWQAILKLFLGVKEYEGNSSVVYLNQDISSVVKESGNLSFATRANRWRGIEQTTISAKCEHTKAEKDKKTIIKFSLVAIISFLLAITKTKKSTKKGQPKLCLSLKFP